MKKLETLISHIGISSNIWSRGIIECYSNLAIFWYIQLCFHLLWRGSINRLCRQMPVCHISEGHADLSIFSWWRSIAARRLSRASLPIHQDIDYTLKPTLDSAMIYNVRCYCWERCPSSRSTASKPRIKTLRQKISEQTSSILLLSISASWLPPLACHRESYKFKFKNSKF